jgi:hypothetical protein
MPGMDHAHATADEAVLIMHKKAVARELQCFGRPDRHLRQMIEGVSKGAWSEGGIVTKAQKAWRNQTVRV